MTVAPYSNIRDAKFEVRETKSTITPAQGTIVDDVQMLGFLRLASRRLTRLIGARFLPYLESKTFSTRPDVITGRRWRINAARGTLLPPEPLLALPTLVTDGDGNALTYSTDYVEDPPGQYPITALRLTGSASWPCFGCKSWYATCNCGPVSQAQITGIWGWHPDYANAYIDSGDTVQDNPLSDSAKTIHVTDADGADDYGRTPRFSPGQIIKMSTELSLINTVNKTTDVLTVTRGVNGTTAILHVKTTAISVFEPDEAIQQATLRWACYPYKRRGNYNSADQNDVGTQITFPADMPGEVAGIVDELVSDIYGGEAI